MPNIFADKHANVKTDLDAILSGDIVIESTEVEPKKTEEKLIETIVSEQDLLSKLIPISEVDIFSFMKNLRGGTYFNMGMFSSIPVARAHKQTFRIYKVVNMTAIVSGVSYENVGTTKDFRDKTGEGPGKAWYDHAPGYENKVGLRKADPNDKYILWDVKASSGNWVAYYLVDISTGAIDPISVATLEASDYLTQTEKNKLRPKQVTGYDMNTGALVTNETVWRTTKFEHVFWLSQRGYELGTKFEESLTGVGASEELEEGIGEVSFRDLHANVDTNLDALLSGKVAEAFEEDSEKIVRKNGKPVQEAKKTYTAKDFAWDDPAIVAEYKDAAIKYMNGADLDDALKGIKAMFKSVGDTIVKGKGPVRESKTSKNLKEAMLDDLEIALHTPGVWGVEFVGEDCVCFDNEADARAYFAECTQDDIYPDSEGIELFKVLDTEGNTETVESISVYNKEDKNFEESCKIKDLKESYRRTVSRGNILVDNELFVDFD